MKETHETTKLTTRSRLPTLPVRHQKVIDAYIDAFSSENPETLKTVSTTIFLKIVERTMKRLQQFSLKKVITFKADKEKNSYLRDNQYLLYRDGTVQSFFRQIYGKLQIAYVDTTTGEIRKRIDLPKAEVLLSYVKSLSPSPDKKISCQNCGAPITLIGDENTCPNCHTLYRFFHFGQMLNTLSIKNAKKENLGLYFFLFGLLLLSLFISYLLANLLYAFFLFPLIMMLSDFLLPSILRRKVKRYQKQVEISDEAVTDELFGSDSLNLISMGLFSTDKERADFLRLYVHEEKKEEVNRWLQKHESRLIDFILKQVRIRKIKERPDGQFLIILIKSMAVKRGIVEHVYSGRQTFKLTLWREADSQTTKKRGVQSRQCPHCAAPLSLIICRRCPYCDTLLAITKEEWKLFSLR